MIRSLALTVSFVVVGAVPALAQVHPPSHVRPPHGQAGHHPLDSAQHAAMHAILHGLWQGTMSHQGVSSGLDLAVAHDSLRKVILSLRTDQSTVSGAATDFAINGHELKWTQELAGKRCKATALLNGETPHAPEMKGTMACEHGDVTFTLHKKKAG